MIALVSVVLILAAIAYGALVRHLAWGLRRVIDTPPPGMAEPPFVSVLVAARDEADHIEACLASILATTYPADRLEVIVVDDFSTDDTAARIEAMAHVPAGTAAEPPLRLLRLHDVAEQAAGHKQAALAHALQAARGEIVLTTDADCRVRPGWIDALVRCFDEETAFVAGPVRFEPGDRWFTRVQALEFMGLVAFGAGGIGVGWPTICNSANVAYRRAVRDAVLGPPDAPAAAPPAADELLLQHVAYETDWRARFCAAPEAIVTTAPVPTLRAFLAQRVRWASMGTRYPRLTLVASVVALYAFFVLLAGTGVAALFAPALLPALLLALVIKVGAERSLLHTACERFEQPRLLRHLVPAQLLQIPYYLYVGVAGTLGPVRWKGRRIQ